MRFTKEEVIKFKRQIEDENKCIFTPIQLIELLSKITVLEKENIFLINQLADMFHKIEHYRWWCDHICILYDETMKKNHSKHG